MAELPAGTSERILQILDITFKRIAYPEWCDIDIEPDDD